MMAKRKCADCEHWTVRWSVCNYSLNPPQRPGHCERGRGIRFANDNACPDFKPKEPADAKVQ